MEVVAIRWYATSSKEGEGAVLPRREESCGNTWKDRVIYCYGRLLGVVVCGCLQGSGASELLLSAGFSLSLSLSLASSILSSLWRAFTVGALVSTNTDTRLPRCYNTATLFLRTSGSPSPSLAILFHLVSSLVPSLSFLSRPVGFVRSSFVSRSVRVLLQRVQRAAHSWYTPLGVQHLPTWPRHNCIRPGAPLTRSTHRDSPPRATKFIHSPPPSPERLYYITSNV